MLGDLYFVNTHPLRVLVDEARRCLDRYPPDEALGALRPAMIDLMFDQLWLPQRFRLPAPSGLGSDVALWLLFRSGQRDLSLFSMVLAPGASTPVHNQGAWALIGQYAGEQDQALYRLPAEQPAGTAPLELVSHSRLYPGDLTTLLPSTGDIYSVAAPGGQPSVSLHLVGNDAGCAWRQIYSPTTGAVRLFRTGWTNMPCPEA